MKNKIFFLFAFLLIGIGTNNLQAQDSDGDGIANNLDLDDDNDGILDTVECPSTYVVRPVLSSSVTANKPITYGTASQIIDGEGAGGTLEGPAPYWYTDVSNLPIAFSMNMQSSSTIDHIKLYAPWGFDEWIGNFRVELYNSSNTLLGTENLTTPNQYIGNPIFSFSTEYTNVTRIRFTILSSQGYSIVDPPRASLKEIVFLDLQQNCDTDGDGIPNHLDLDSDNDGCPDAIEGGASLTSANLVSSSMPGGNSGATSGSFNQPITQNLGNMVNTTSTSTSYGVPTVAGSGQTLGTSITANPVLLAGTAGANQTITSGSTPTALSLTGATGSIQWQVSTDNLTFTNVSGATNATYAPGSLTITRYYRAIVTSVGGCTAISNTVTINVNNPCLSSATNPDSDGDGISDYCDLDDDNDGILDIAEGVVDNDGVLEWNYNAQNDTPSILNSSVISSAQNATKSSALTAQIIGVDTSYSITGVSATTISQSRSNNSYFEFKFTTANFQNTVQYLYDRFSLWVRDPSFSPTYKMRLYLSTDNFATSTDISGEVAYPIVPYEDRVVFPLTSPYHLAPNKTYTLRLYFYDVSGGASATFSHDDFQVLTTQYADTDTDGIPNHLDLDSDNDGCVDAFEGDENVTNVQLTTASGTVTVGIGSTASNQNLGNSVDANGVPTVVNSGGAADIGSDQGQGVGTSANSSFKDVQCSSVFGCTSAMYLSQYDTLYSVATSTNPFTYPTVGTASVNYNAIAINPLDGRMYGMQVPTSNNLLVINPDGSSVNLGPITGLPTGKSYLAGEIDNLGNYYVKEGTDNQQLYKINLSTKTATLITLNTSIYVPDFAFNITNGLLYGVNVDTGQLMSINPTTKAVTPIGVTSSPVSFGAMFASSTGEFYGVENDGAFYKFNLTTGQRIFLSTATQSQSNDGAHCVTAPIVFSADLAITKDDGKANYSPGTTNTYTVVVSNNDGPFGVLGAKVSDPVPAGIPAGNVSYSVPVVTGGATTSITSAQTGALNDVVNIPKGGTITYTITIAVPISYSGDLVNVATVTSPANSTDPTPSNNTDTDTDSSVCYKSAVVDAGNTYPTKHGITALGRAGVENENWPMVRQSAWTVLESKEKGFVVNRVNNTADLVNITNPVEGMMVYDNQANCLKIYTLKSGDTIMGWHCFTTPACPD